MSTKKNFFLPINKFQKKTRFNRAAPPGGVTLSPFPPPTPCRNDEAVIMNKKRIRERERERRIKKEKERVRNKALF